MHIDNYKPAVYIFMHHVITYALGACPSFDFAAADIIAADDVYEKAMSATTIIYEWQGEGVDGKYVVARKDFHQKPSKEMLDTTKVSQ